VKMKKEMRELVNYRLHRATETLDDARLLLNNEKLFSAVNRIYYALFYAVSALLLTKGLSSAKHSGILSLFNKEFISNGKIDKKWGRYYYEMFDFRQKADYKDLVHFAEKDVRQWLRKAEDFIPFIQAFIS